MGKQEAITMLQVNGGDDRMTPAVVKVKRRVDLSLDLMGGRGDKLCWWMEYGM